MKYTFLLAAFLGAVALGLFWLSGIVDSHAEAARAAGKAECEAEQAEKIMKQTEKKIEVQNVQNRKMAVVWSRPGSRLGELIKRMREQGIGTGAGVSSGGCISGRRC